MYMYMETHTVAPHTHVHIHTNTHSPSLSAMCMSASGERPTTESGSSVPPITNDMLAGRAVFSGGDALVNAVCGVGSDSSSGVKGWSLVGEPLQQFPIV